MSRRLAAAAALLALAAGALAAVILGTHSSGSATTQTVTATGRRHSVADRHIVRPRPSRAQVPILMYHVVGIAPAGAAFPSLFVPPAELTAQVNWLAAHGFHAVTLQRLFAAWKGTRALPPKPVVLTFDDGYLSDYTAALPTLRRHHWPGVLNLAVKNLAPGDIEPWQVRKLIAAGWEIGAHTMSHVDLTTLDPARLRYEVAGSRAAIRHRFGVPVDAFCYPAGRYNAQVIAAVKAAGFLGATTENPGLARKSERFTLARIRIDPGDGVSGLIRKLRAGSALTQSPAL
jgi:peptidoglycan/xylan/chitin deacetylase (PgdA/CDA1 family)